jgi:hypothetical protein
MDFSPPSLRAPDVVMPSQYLPKVFGGEISDSHAFGSLEEANNILALLMRHWNDIAATLSKGDVYLPILLEDENGVSQGNDWARGFTWAMSLMKSADQHWFGAIASAGATRCRRWIFFRSTLRTFRPCHQRIPFESISYFSPPMTPDCGRPSADEIRTSKTTACALGFAFAAGRPLNAGL